MSQIDDVRIALVQCDIADLDIERNLGRIEEQLAALSGQADLVLFPEAITTGFSKEATRYADAWETGRVYQTLCSLSKQYGLALAATYFVREGQGLYNRFVLVDGDEVQWQDKRHLFSLGGEPDMVTPTTERRVLTFRSWRIMPLVCYDLRFPVWSRCVNNDYDIIICLANWPKGRREVWSTLLRARAMENLAYAVGVNRVGSDAMGLEYLGDSVVCNPRGQILHTCPPGEVASVVSTLSYAPLADLRRKFPVWQDADAFVIK